MSQGFPLLYLLFAKPKASLLRRSGGASPNLRGRAEGARIRCEPQELLVPGAECLGHRCVRSSEHMLCLLTQGRLAFYASQSTGRKCRPGPGSPGDLAFTQETISSSSVALNS